MRPIADQTIQALEGVDYGEPTDSPFALEFRYGRLPNTTSRWLA